MNVATDHDHRIIDATSIALGGKIGLDDDVQRLKERIEQGEGEDKLNTACEIAVAFIRWAQDLKKEPDPMKCPKCGGKKHYAIRGRHKMARCFTCEGNDNET